MLFQSAALASGVCNGSSGVGGPGSKQNVFHSFSLNFVGGYQTRDFSSAVSYSVLLLHGRTT